MAVNSSFNQQTQDLRETRDLAVRADTKVHQHIQDCIAFRGQIMRTFDTIREDIKDVKNDNKKVNLHMAFIIGGLIVLSTLLTSIPNIIRLFMHSP